MKNDIKSLLNKYNLEPKKITIKNKTIIIDDELVIKPRINSDIINIYDYLHSRAFDYFPYPLEITDGREVYPYIKDNPEPVEEKYLDIMHTVSLLHNKTTFYQDIDIDKIKGIYEDTVNKVNYLNNYYTNLIENIEKEIYMAPSSYLLARNISILFESISYVRDSIEKWYKLVKDNKNKRVVYIHGNVKLEHFINGDKPYLISWVNSRVDSPIYDLLIFYKNNYQSSFMDLLKYYEHKYPLKDYERLLLFSLMAIPPTIKENENEYNKCININEIIDYLYKTKNIIMNYQK